MSEAKHTPGPWHLIRCGGKDGSAVATIEPKPDMMVAPNYWLVATANTLREEWAANARLIAAAPELLEALTAIVADFDMDRGAHIQEGGGDIEDTPEIGRARAAISRATGGK